jgi:hypothetical protein
MTKKTSLLRKTLAILLVAVICCATNILVRKTTISTFTIFDTTTLFTYFGVLIGFALTIYTFGLSMVTDIKQKIEENKKFTEAQKVLMYDNLVNGFAQIKSDIWIIFYSILIVILFSIAKEIENPFNWNVEELKLPETINITLFITTTIAMWDIMQTLFNLSEINLELNKK